MFAALCAPWTPIRAPPPPAQRKLKLTMRGLCPSQGKVVEGVRLFRKVSPGFKFRKGDVTFQEGFPVLASTARESLRVVDDATEDSVVKRDRFLSRPYE